MNHVVIVTTTLPFSMSNDEVIEFKTKFLQSKLSACSQSKKINSTYFWEGEIISEHEWEISFKTTAKNLDELISTISKEHPYEIPQITHGVELSTEEYVNWISMQVN